MYLGITYALAIVSILSLGMGLYVVIGKGLVSMLSLVVAPIAMLPLLVICIKRIDQIKKELENR